MIADLKNFRITKSFDFIKIYMRFSKKLCFVNFYSLFSLLISI